MALAGPGASGAGAADFAGMGDYDPAGGYVGARCGVYLDGPFTTGDEVSSRGTYNAADSNLVAT